MWAAEAAVVRPENEPDIVSVVPLRVIDTVPMPMRAPPPSCAPSRWAIKFCAWARESVETKARELNRSFIIRQWLLRTDLEHSHATDPRPESKTFFAPEN